MQLDYDTLIEAITDVIDERFKGMSRDDTDIRVELDALKAENAALRTALDDKASADAVVTLSEQMETNAVKRLAAQDETLTKLKSDLEEWQDGIFDKVDAHSNSINHLKAMDNTFAESLTDIEQKQEDAAKLIDDLDIRKQAAEVVETHWDEVGKAEVAAMLPDDWQPALEKAVKGFEQHIAEIELAPGPEGPAGVDGKDAEVDYAHVTNVVQQYVADNAKLFVGETGPEGQTGPQGERGEAGEPGAKGDTGPRGEKGDTPEAIAPTELQIMDAVRGLWPDIKKVMAKTLPTFEHKGVWDAETQYDVGDEVIRSGSTFRKLHETDEAPGNGADGWQMISQGKRGGKGLPGRDGEQGPAGPAGKDGVSFKDVVIADGKMMVVELTDGTVKELDLTDFIETVIKAIGE